MYSFSYQLEDTDYLEFNKFHYSTAPGHKRLERAVLAFAVIASAGFTFLRFAGGDVYDFAAAAIAGFLVALIIFVILRLTFKPLTELILRMYIKSIKKDGKLPFGRNVQLTFEDDFFIESTEVAQTKQQYAVVEKVMEGQRAVYIYTGAMQALIIPVSVFENNERKHEFLSFINSKTSLGRISVRKTGGL